MRRVEARRKLVETLGEDQPDAVLTLALAQHAAGMAEAEATLQRAAEAARQGGRSDLTGQIERARQRWARE